MKNVIFPLLVKVNYNQHYYYNQKNAPAIVKDDSFKYLVEHNMQRLIYYGRGLKTNQTKQQK